MNYIGRLISIVTDRANSTLNPYRCFSSGHETLWTQLQLIYAMIVNSLVHRVPVLSPMASSSSLLMLRATDDIGKVAQLLFHL